MVFTQQGINRMIDFLDGDSPTPPSHIATGTDSTAETDEDTTLGSESGRRAFDTKTATTDQITYTVIFPITQLNGQTLREAGVFNASLSGDMFNRFTHSAITKSPSVEVQYDITIRGNN